MGTVPWNEYEVAFPVVSGWRVYTVLAKDEEAATNKVLAGDIDGEYEDLEVNYDSNLAIVTEL
jgi:hypothetical protein